MYSKNKVTKTEEATVTLSLFPGNLAAVESPKKSS